MIWPQCMWHMVSYGWCLSHKEKHTDKLAAYKTGRKIYLCLSITGLKFTTRNIPHLIYFSFFFPEISRGSVCLSPDTRRKSWPALSRWDSTVTTSLPLNLCNFIQWSLHSVIYLTDVKSGGRWLLLFLPSQLDGDFVLFFYNSMCCLFLYGPGFSSKTEQILFDFLLLRLLCCLTMETWICIFTPWLILTIYSVHHLHRTGVCSDFDNLGWTQTQTFLKQMDPKPEEQTLKWCFWTTIWIIYQQKLLPL